MNGSKIEIDEQLIDALVTGELTGERYRQALRALDADPSKWRDCALAFLAEQALAHDLTALARTENQSWGAELTTATDRVAAAGQIAGGPAASLPVAKSLIESVDSLSVGAGGVGAAAVELAGGASPDQKRSPRMRDHHWLSPHAIATAALLLVSFLIGWMGSELAATRGRPGEVRNAPANAIVQSNTLPKAQPFSDKAELGSPRQAPTGAAPSVQYILDQKGNFMPLDRAIPPQLVELERQGKIRFDSVDGIVPVTREDGSVEVVPVQMFSVVPVMHAY